MASIIAICLENVISNEMLKYIGLTDSLTGVYNRRYIDRRLLEEIARARRQNYCISCMYIDIDHFKSVNDTHGHQGGDEVLREVATRIRTELRRSDALGRFGGEEFVVLLIDADLDSATFVAERIRASIAGTMFDLPGSAQAWVSVSIGVASLGARNHLMDSMDYASADELRRLGKTFDVLARQSGIVLVDGVVADEGDCFPVPLMASSDIVVQVSTSATSIKAAYCLIKRLSQELGRRPFGILVTGASESEAKVVYDNMAQAASRYLAVKLTSMGSVPADEYLHRAARLGRSVVDAFPLAGASVAFRGLAERLARSAAPVLGGTLYQTGSAHQFSA
ncbi:MAG: diguanylate cyclase [Janthinobacterium sp.]